MSETTSEPMMDGDFSDEVTSAFFNDLAPEEHEAETKRRPPKEPEEASTPPKADPKEPKEDLDEDEEASTEADPDDDEVELKVGEDTVKAKMRDLKAAFATREEATRTSAEAAQRRTQADAEYQRSNLALQKATEKAEARWKPYANFDWLALSRDPSIDHATFQAARAEATAALEEYRFFKEELDAGVAAQTAQQNATRNAEAAATVKILSDPKTGIPGWNQQLYGDLMAYADTQGAPKGVPQQMTAAWAFKMMHKAYLYDKGVTSTTAKIEKVVNRPSRTLKPSGSNGTGESGKSLKSAMQALQRSGSTDDAADAFMASFGDA